MKNVRKEIEVGTIRIKVKDLQPYEKTKSSWKKTTKQTNNALQVINLFSKHNNLDLLIDKKNPKFFKGALSKDNKSKGARITVLPNNQKLTGAYSLFAKNLTIHDQKSNDHWDVIYENPSGYCYIYDIDKRQHAVQNKYKKVKQFGKVYPLLEKNVIKSLRNKNDDLAIPMYTLLKTYMRIGNEIYYKAHGHKGLTTLKKKDISIKGNKVIFNYIAKDGVPLKLEEKFPKSYINRLKILLSKTKTFVFISKTGHPLTDVHFKHAFKKYCGKEFYPHIVRSYFATSQANIFLKSHKKATKAEVKDFLLSVAEKLGHRRFDKKDNTWKENYNVTIHHYINPELVEKINSISK